MAEGTNYLGHEGPDAEKAFELDDAKEFYGCVEVLLDSLYVKWEQLNSQRERLAEAPPE